MTGSAHGYDWPLYILPFDHRHSYGAEVFGFHEPMSPQQIAVVSSSKQVIYEGYKLAVERGADSGKSGIPVDEEFGATILRDAHSRGYNTCMPVEKSGQHEFDFEFGDDFSAHLEAFDPTFTKVLVRYNPQDDPELNQRQLDRLRRLSIWLRDHGRKFMFEMLVPALPEQLQAVGGQQAYDDNLRPELMVQSIAAIQDHGIEPDVWKIEGLDRREDCQKIVDAARRDGRDGVGLIVLGRGESEPKVVEWLQVAAGVPGFIGFAVGRSTFLQTIVSLRAGQLDEQAAADQIATKFLHWIEIFESAARR
jgi:myo-inositol catabolism protein IolC